MGYVRITDRPEELFHYHGHLYHYHDGLRHHQVLLF